MSQLCAPRACPIHHRSRMFAMIRMPLATASLLAIAISLAGCGEGKDKAAAPQAPTPAASTTAPAAAATAGQVDEAAAKAVVAHYRSEEHTSELQSLMRISYAVFCLKKKKQTDALHKNKTYKHN